MSHSNSSSTVSGSNAQRASQLPKSSSSSTSKRGPSGPLRLYLLAFNVASLLGWAYILLLLLTHLLGPTVSSYRSGSASSSLSLSSISHSVLSRTRTAHAAVGTPTRWVQTAALLEIAHVALGLVRSGLGTTSAQVASRLVLVWGVLAQFPFPAIRESPVFSTMVLAWSSAECVRYATYALALLETKSGMLEWLRYSLFYVLYPLGAGSEAYLMYASIPYARAKFGRNGAVALVILVLVWPPALFVMMSHMHAQRKKHIGGGKAKAKAQIKANAAKKRA